MHETLHSAVDEASKWTMPSQEKEVKKLKVLVEARFLFVPLGSEGVDLGSFLSRFREVGDVIFVPQRIRASNDDALDGSSAITTFSVTHR